MKTSDKLKENSTTHQPTVDLYDAYIYFGSRAAGPPSNKPLVQFLDSFENQYQVKTGKIDRIGPLGREGEYGLGFVLKDWKATTKQQFIDGLKKIQWENKSPSSGYVVITENEKISTISKSPLSETEIFQR